MKKETVTLGQLILVGLTVRTNNKNEMHPETSKIAALAGNYWQNQIANQFKNRLNPGVTYSLYTDYESDEHGDYTYFVGEIVTARDDHNQSHFQTLVIPAQRYQKFTTTAGKMPQVVIEAWQKIWTMNAVALGGKRRYLADFEVYDQRAMDPNHSIVDVYVGIE